MDRVNVKALLNPLDEQETRKIHRRFRLKQAGYHGGASLLTAESRPKSGRANSRPSPPDRAFCAITPMRHAIMGDYGIVTAEPIKKRSLPKKDMELMKEDSLTSEEKLLRLIRKRTNLPKRRLWLCRKIIPLFLPTCPDTANGELRPGREAERPEKQMDVLALSIRVLAVTACVILILVLNEYALLRTKPLAAPETSFSSTNYRRYFFSLEEEGRRIACPAIETRSFESL